MADDFTVHAYRYTGAPGSGAMIDLGTLGGRHSIASAINASGQVVGQSGTAMDATHAFRYVGTPGVDGVMQDLGTLADDVFPLGSSAGFAINDSGQVAGMSNSPQGVLHAFRYTGTPGVDGVMEDLGTLGGTFSQAYAINASGQVSGFSGTNGNADTHAFLYTGTLGSGGVMTDLGTLGGSGSGGYAINAAGHVAGDSAIEGDATAHAFLYTGTPGSDGAMVDLGTLGGSYSMAWAINNFDQVAGTSDTKGNVARRAFLYTGTPSLDGVMIDLDAWLDLVNPAEGAKWFLHEATGLTDAGLITGNGYYDDGAAGQSDGFRAFVLDASSFAVPEPSTLVFLSVGLVSLAFVSKSRRTALGPCRHKRSVFSATLTTALVALLPTMTTRADIFQWEYVNPADLNQGKQQSMTLAPDGAGVTAGPFADLSFRNLTKAYLNGDDLRNATAQGATLANAELSWSNLTIVNLIGADLRKSTAQGTNFTNANLTDANLTNANWASYYDDEFGFLTDLTGANLHNAVVLGTNFTGAKLTISQIASTASYQAGNLAGIGLQGVNLTGANLAGQNLSNATFNGATLTGADLRHINAAGVVFAHANLNNASFEDANLANSYFNGAVLHNTDFSGAFLAAASMGYTPLGGANLSAAVVRFADLTETGITLAQLYSTASYQAHDLRGVVMSADLTGGDFAGQDLAGARLNYATMANVDLRHANLVNADLAGFVWYDGEGGVYVHPGTDLTNANLTGVDARRANLQYVTLTGANTLNMIQPNGRIAGLDLTADRSLIVRDYDGNSTVFPNTGPLPIVVEQHLVADATGSLHFVFDVDAWNSTISFEPGALVERGGVIDLSFETGVDVGAQIGRTIDLFDWTGVTPTGTFDVSSPYTWDLCNLYTTGEVTITAVPGLVPGDFSGNGVVDAADYVVWRDNFGIQSGAMSSSGDGDSDGDVDGADYLVWQRNFGRSFGSGSELPSTEPLSTVPEPAAPATILTGLLLSMFFRQRPEYYQA